MSERLHDGLDHATEPLVLPLWWCGSDLAEVGVERDDLALQRLKREGLRDARRG